MKLEKREQMAKKCKKKLKQREKSKAVSWNEIVKQRNQMRENEQRQHRTQQLVCDSASSANVKCVATNIRIKQRAKNKISLFAVRKREK